MAWTKTEPAKTAKVSNQDLRAVFSFSDPSDPIPNDMRFRLHIETEAGQHETTEVRVQTTLTAGERTSLNALLVKLRDAALAQAGYVNA